MNKVRRYGKWAGNERGTAEDTERCLASIYPADGWISRQCGRKRKKDDLCTQHYNTKSTISIPELEQ